MKKAFTLIELLVVIAIIAILAAILFPVFAQANAAAKKTSALSNVKQNALGILMYISDFDDAFPIGCPDDWEHYEKDSTGTPRTPAAGWTVTTKPYIKNVGILRDPSDSLNNPAADDYVQARLLPGGDAVYISFVSNGWMNNAAPDWNWGMWGIIGMYQNWMGGPKTQTSTGVSNAADTIMLAARYSSTDVWGPDSFIAGVSWWDGTGFGGLAPDGTRSGAPYGTTTWSGRSVVFNKDNRNGGVTAGYADKATFAWADGHASTVSPASTNPNPGARPELNKWNSRR
jgi:prepilin-type N-terminal cleavage/methylation domain-containing protein/prepilin-type processing-associated H-X9-DG protein